MKPKRNWCQIATALQLKEILAEDMPRLLFECIQDLNIAMDESTGLVLDIKSTIDRLEEQVEQRTKG